MEHITGNLLALITVATMVASVVFAGYQYRQVHLPEFRELQATVTYQQCIQQCENVCRANSIPLDRCNCGHCNVYRMTVGFMEPAE